MVTRAKKIMTEPPTKIMIQLWFNISDKYKSTCHRLESEKIECTKLDNSKIQSYSSGMLSVLI